MRNVREGFGNRSKAFSGKSKRGRFGMDKLLAADGSVADAKRLGLANSDEEDNGDEEGGEAVEEDEEVMMERMLKERHMKDFYATSDSESESEDEDEQAQDGEKKVVDPWAEVEKREKAMATAEAKRMKIQRVLSESQNDSQSQSLLDYEDSQLLAKMKRTRRRQAANDERVSRLTQFPGCRQWRG